MADRSKAAAAAGSSRLVRGANDNPQPGEACVTDAGAPLPSSSITAEELRLLQPLISALAMMAVKRVSATTLSSDPEVRRCA
jgi:hypothetical protein